MRIEQIKQQLLPIAEQAEADGDKYCFVYFSREQDAYSGGYDMDSGDALLVINQLVEKFGLDKDALIESLFDTSDTGNFTLDPKFALALACGKN